MKPTRKVNWIILTPLPLSPPHQPCTVDLQPKSQASGSSSHPSAIQPLAPPIGTLWPASAADSARTLLYRYGSGGQAPFPSPNPVHPSPRGPDKRFSVGEVIVDLPSHPLPAEVMQLPDRPAAISNHCPPSKFKNPKHSFLVPFDGITPLGDTGDNHDPPVKSLVNSGPGLHKWGTVRTHPVIKQTEEKMKEIMDLVGSWLHKATANIQDLGSLLGKLLFVA